MADGQRCPIFRPSGALEAILLSARAVLPIKSSSVLSPPPLQKNPNLKPLKGLLNPQLLVLTQQMGLLPTTPEMRLPEIRPHPLALPPPNREVMTPKPQKRFPHPPASTRAQSKHMFPLREVAGPLLAPTSLHTPIQALTKHLLQTPSLYLLDNTKPFFLFVHSPQGHSLGILCQKQGGWRHMGPSNLLIQTN